MDEIPPAPARTVVANSKFASFLFPGLSLSLSLSLLLALSSDSDSAIPPPEAPAEALSLSLSLFEMGLGKGLEFLLLLWVFFVFWDSENGSRPCVRAERIAEGWGCSKLLSSSCSSFANSSSSCALDVRRAFSVFQSVSKVPESCRVDCICNLLP